MKFLVVLAALILIISAASDQDQWLQFKDQYCRDYRNLEEENRRFSIFQSNLRIIEEHNGRYAKGETSYYLGVTQFADLTHEEFMSTINCSSPGEELEFEKLSNETEAEVMARGPAPLSIDWRAKGKVSRVKDQGRCESCWAFGTVAALESAYAIKRGRIISLSEQNLIDCTFSYGNSGCSGGSRSKAFQYVVDNGIQTETDYPYRARDGTCRYSPYKSAMTIRRYVRVYQNERALQQTVGRLSGTIGPVSAGVNAGGFNLYRGGVLNNKICTRDINHSVLVVGYGTESGKEYWIVKNSWGDNWGEAGYMKMSRNNNNQCGITLRAMYPVM